MLQQVDNEGKPKHKGFRGVVRTIAKKSIAIFRNLKEPMVPRAFSSKLTNMTAPEGLELFFTTMAAQPQVYRQTLAVMMVHLRQIIAQEGSNSMCADALSVVYNQTLRKSKICITIACHSLFDKVMEQARQAKESTQKDLATGVNEKPQVVTEYENNGEISGNSKREKDSLRKKARKFSVVKGKLYYVVNGKQREVIKHSDVEKTIEEAHIALSHHGRNAVVSPFELATGCKMIWPQDLDPKWAKEEDVELTEGEIDNFESIQEEVAMERLEKLTEIIEVRRMARENILAEQKKYKSRYNKMHNPQWFEVGEKVTMQNDRKRGRKGDVLACNRTYGDHIS
ncbi:hypothetical protein QR680_001807 [Steinernema hermaphroditum]|uniref:Rho-GAP domain-containing protein n=1 Tax=Steinernema hermaphroditum TaxID=289476 RepID=A0AA39H210_9BILA|nr:hypothetical protein QR680_001807 [Steinernema hermaphroditum]